MTTSRPESASATAPDRRALVTVGIPTLGSLPLLVEAVESVFAQTFDRWELIVGENGVGDAEVEAALAPYVTEPRMTHVVTGERVGRGENWSNLIRAGSAPYVALLHDDDRWEPEFLDRRVAFLEAHPECGWVFSDYIVIDGDGTRRAG